MHSAAIERAEGGVVRGVSIRADAGYLSDSYRHRQAPEMDAQATCNETVSFRRHIGHVFGTLRHILLVYHDVPLNLTSLVKPCVRTLRTLLEPS